MTIIPNAACYGRAAGLERDAAIELYEQLVAEAEDDLFFSNCDSPAHTAERVAAMRAVLNLVTKCRDTGGLQP